jgi:hypothetical protein
MAPQVNGSSTFSQCSLNSMQELLQTAACLIPIAQPDVAVAADLDSVQGYANSPLTWSVTVANVGDAPSTSVHIDVSLPTAVQVVSANIGGGTCTTADATLSCDLPTLAANSTRVINITAQTSTVGAWSIVAVVRAASDVDPTNNAGIGSLAIDPSVDLAAALSIPSTVAAEAPTTAQFTVSNSSDEDAQGVVADIDLPQTVVVTSAALEGATCTVQGASAHCSLDTLAAHTSRNGTLQLTANAVGTGTMHLHVSGAYHDPDTSNNTVTRTFSVDAAVNAVTGKQDGASSGGGGAFDWLLLSCGSLLARTRLRRTKSLDQPSR